MKPSALQIPPLQAFCALLAVTLAAVTGLAGCGAQDRRQAPAPALVRYLDCGRAHAGPGTLAAPWTSLAQVRGVVFGPGSRLLLRRGSRCRGTLVPRGSGAAARPILIGAYGRGPRPRIATDSLAPDALTLAGSAFVTVESLDLSNRGNGTQPRRGMHVIAIRTAQPHDIVLRDLVVHDIGGNERKGLDGSAGIEVDDPSRNVVIEGNGVSDVHRSGIVVIGSGVDPRPAAGSEWHSASTGVVIAGNAVARASGDGIVATGTVAAQLRGNIVCCSNLAGRPGAQYDAGIWAFDANSTVIERNVVFDMARLRADGSGFDIDYDQDGTVLQDNVGVGNAGGFALLCTDAPPHHAVVRFNLSVGELPLAVASCAVRAQPGSSLRGIQVYNNTFLTPTADVWLNHIRAVHALPASLGLRFFNNLMLATRSLHRPFPCAGVCTHNLFWGLPPSGSAAIHADPRLAGSPGAAGAARAVAGRRWQAFRPRARSPALATGLPLPAGTRDFFGQPVTAAPIGFATGSGR